MRGGFSKLDRRRAFEAIVDQIREAIFRRRYRVGERLPSERELAAQFGVARHAVREAIRVLEHSGMVSVRRGSRGGAFVAEPRSEAKGSLLDAAMHARGVSIEDLFRSKMLIEPQVAEIAAVEATEKELAGIGEILEREARALADGDAYEEVSRFHTEIARTLHNPILDEMVRALEATARLLHRAGGPAPGVYALAHKEHAAIYAALRRRRASASRTAMAEHLKAMETRYLKSLARRPGGSVARQRPAGRAG